MRPYGRQRASQSWLMRRRRIKRRF
jgi:hypothetical protein